jgi:hypothetical protein
MDVNRIKAIQGIVGVTQDGIWGPKSQAALNSVLAPDISNDKHSVIASSFADPKDVAAFKRCKAEGKSDDECFKVGDNAIGAWGDSTAEGTGPSCALPPDDLIAKWQNVNQGRNKSVLVEANGKSVVCIVKDRMPWKKDIRNGAGIDLNPDAVRALGWEPPILNHVTWSWWA